MTPITRWAATYLDQQWPSLDPIPEGRDMFAAHPVYYPPHMTTESSMRDEIKCDLERLDDGRWLVTVYRNGKHERRVRFNTQEAAVAFADAQLWATQGG